jgi:hypothetical protein
MSAPSVSYWCFDLDPHSDLNLETKIYMFLLFPHDERLDDKGLNPSDLTTVNLGHLLSFSECFDVIVIAGKLRASSYS